MRIALHQGPAQPADAEANLDVLAATARSAADGGARLLVFPEMFLTGYNIGPDAVRRLAEPADGPSAQQVARIAQETGIAVLYGYPELVGDAVYNAAQLVERDGRRLTNYRKTHLFGELDTAAFSPGAGGFVTVQVDDLRVGVLICYDVEFPEAVRALALAGADLVAVPTALMAPYDAVAQTLVPARAIENQVFVAYANHSGQERELTYTGLSCVIGSDGGELVRAGRDAALVFADLDPERHAAARSELTYLQDRRPELYGSLLSPQEVRP
ncbi:MAG: putative hydrolase [Frankiales bacterium]|jgi:predicted amidohydrolase|nr:putative hydrolase [Frankiales bacterium]